MRCTLQNEVTGVFCVATVTQITSTEMFYLIAVRRHRLAAMPERSWHLRTQAKSEDADANAGTDAEAGHGATSRGAIVELGPELILEVRPPVEPAIDAVVRADSG